MPRLTQAETASETLPMLSTAAEVWEALKQSGLQLKSYDSSLPDDLLQALHPSPPEAGAVDLETFLATESVSVERFLAAFFQAVQPYADMMADLLRLFEEAGAVEGTRNLAVQFDFGADMPPLSFDLEHFRKWRETWQRATATCQAEHWDYKALWDLNDLLRRSNDEPRDAAARAWLASYFEGGSDRRGLWADVDLPAPRSGRPRLDTALAWGWEVWRTVVRESKQFGRDRKEFRFERGPDPTPEEPWPRGFLTFLDSDHWAGSFAAGAYCRAEEAAASDSGEADVLAKRLEDLFSARRAMVSTRDVMVKVLQEFLSLPAWQRRHELYSAWVATQILGALRGHGVQVHSANGQLRFEFRGTHLATVGLHPNLHLMAELRSPLEAPRGKGRQRAIQPDYSLAASPITAPSTSVLVVECKQYLAASRKGFADALTDYARGRPNAQVILVNYGPAAQDILDAVDPLVRARTHIVGGMRPRAVQAQAEFADLVHQAVTGWASRPPPHRRAPAASAPADAVGQATLEWSAPPADLDLHLRIERASGSSRVNYQQRGDLLRDPWASLDQDVLDGRGVETIQVARWTEGTYHFAVHNYSGNAPLAGSKARLLLHLGAREITFECPAHGQGHWWDVASYSPTTGKLEVRNRLTHSIP